MNFIRNRTKKEHYALWMRDYKPESLSEVAGNADIVNSLKMYISVGDIPNILLTGPNGTGKKNLAELTAKEYLGEHYKYGCIQIDGSINRGKDIVTNTNDYKKQSTDKFSTETYNIMTFAKSKIQLDNKKKIIIIYNFDYMTSEAQNAMRRIIELYAKNTRFILICNEIEGVIEAIQSRCIPLKTSLVEDSEIKKLMKQILIKDGKEPDSISDEILDTVCILSGGDIKKAINYLQVISNSPTPTIETFYKIFNIPPIHNIVKILDSVQSESTYQVAYDTLDKLLENGYDASDILEIFVTTVVKYDKIPLDTKIAYLHAISKCYVKTELSKTNSNLFSLVARLGRMNTEGYINESI